jgi:hypothetical protein
MITIALMAIVPVVSALGTWFVFGDAAAAAAIGGVFSCLNTALNAWILRRLGQTRTQVDQTREKVDETHRIMTAPRRALYDSEGRIVGTMLDLKTDEKWIAQAQRDAEGEP